MTSQVFLLLANRRVPCNCGISKGVCLARISVFTHIFQIKVKGTRKFKNYFVKILKFFTRLFCCYVKKFQRFYLLLCQNYRRIFPFRVSKLFKEYFMSGFHRILHIRSFHYEPHFVITYFDLASNFCKTARISLKISDPNRFILKIFRSLFICFHPFSCYDL